MYIAALDIGGTKTIAAVTDESGMVLSKVTFPTLVHDSYENLNICVHELRQMLSARGLGFEALAGIGVSLPGIVDREKGVLLYAPYSKWENVDFAGILRSETGVSLVECENDVNACAEGELTFGLGDRYTDFIWMTVSTGVGGAVVADSKLLRGMDGFAGELGHLKVEYADPYPCPCGQLGCLEAHGSGTALNRLVAERQAADPAFAAALSELCEGRADGKACSLLAAAGNTAAREIFETVGVYLGRGISYCINILNPQAVVIGGGVSASLDLLMPGIMCAVHANAFKKMSIPDIVQTPLGYEAALIGAAALVRQRCP